MEFFNRERIRKASVTVGIVAIVDLFAESLFLGPVSKQRFALEMGLALLSGLSAGYCAATEGRHGECAPLLKEAPPAEGLSFNSPTPGAAVLGADV